LFDRSIYVVSTDGRTNDEINCDWLSIRKMDAKNNRVCHMIIYPSNFWIEKKIFGTLKYTYV